MHTITIHNQNKYFHRPESNSPYSNRNSQLSTNISSTMQDPFAYSHQSPIDQSQSIHIDGGDYQYSESFQEAGFNMQTIPDSLNESYHHHPSTTVNNSIQSWEQLLGVETAQNDHSYQDVSQTDLNTTQKSINNQLKQNEDFYQFNTNDGPFEEVNADLDYETIVRSKNLYNDPQPQIIRKPTQPNPVVYNQKVIVRFLQPPPVEQGPLIIREVRPPQPPPQPPLIIRQRPAPVRSPSPLILRERPPQIPDAATQKVVTRTLPPLPPPPRSVIVEKLPPLPPKPRDIIIERWIPYESMQKRKVIVHRADAPKAYPKPKNVIIVYEPVQSCVVRRFERLGVTQEDPNRYSSMYRNALLTTEQLMAQVKELGINIDLCPPQTPVYQQQQQTPLNVEQQNYDYNFNAPQRSSTSMSNSMPNNFLPVYENLINGSMSNVNYEESHTQQFDQNNPYYLNTRDDLSNHLGSYGLTDGYISN